MFLRWIYIESLLNLSPWFQVQDTSLIQYVTVPRANIPRRRLRKCDEINKSFSLFEQHDIWDFCITMESGFIMLSQIIGRRCSLLKRVNNFYARNKTQRMDFKYILINDQLIIWGYQTVLIWITFLFHRFYVKLLITFLLDVSSNVSSNVIF